MEQLDVASTVPCVGMDHEESTHGSLNISDVIEVLRTTDPEYVGATKDMYAGVDAAASMDDARKRSAYVKLLEQPASKALRFRYECEGRSAGSIPGVNSTPENKTFPSIQIMGYKGRAVVVVSCVTKDPPYRPHPHNLVGKEGCKKGVCTMELNNENMSVTFSNLGIQCVKKKDIEEALRVREEIRVDPYRTGFSHRSQPTSIDLNAVRLCFQVFLEGSVRGKFTFQLNPIVSDPIFDKKAMSDLVICKLSDCSCSVAGGKEIILLCEKVAKEDIQVRFYEERGGHIVWESYGDFQPTQVHKQVAISFRSPRYSSLEVDAPVKVSIQLRRPSDGATSEPLPFEFLPLDSGRPAFWSLRKALAKKGNYTMFSSILASNTAMLTGGSDVCKEAASAMPERLAAVSGTLGQQLDTETFNTNAEVGEVKEDSIDVVEIMEEDEEEVAVETDNVTTFQTDSNVAVDNWPDTVTVNNNNNANVEVNTKSDEPKSELIYREDANGDTCRSLNELLSQVAELDVIYSDRKSELSGMVNNDNEDSIEIDVQDMYNDNQTYSSLQMAFKNPIEVLEVAPVGYEDVMPSSSPFIINNKRESVCESDSKLPPLPPKRIKKSPPALPTRPSHLLLSNSPDPVVIEAPTKNLPPAPEPAAKSQSKPNIFQKFFSKKSPKSGSKKDLSSGSLKGSVGNVSTTESLRKRSVDDVSIDRNQASPADEDTLPRNDSAVNVTLTNQDFSPEVELTEAEHFALYTDVAPHATQSEFDEMSFYYSPVEGGKIVTPPGQSPKTDIAT